RQPVSRSRVSAVRGVNCDAVMRTLTLRGLVEEAGTERETGAILYRTTSYFLERLGLASLDELPDLAPFLPDQVETAAQARDEQGRWRWRRPAAGRPGRGRRRRARFPHRCPGRGPAAEGAGRRGPGQPAAL